MIHNASATMLPHESDGDTIGGRLSRARDAAGLSLNDLASQAGVRKETVAQWERDRSEPRANKLVTLAGLLGVSPTWLMTGTGEGPVDQSASDAKNSVILLNEVKRLQGELATAIGALEQEILASKKV